MLFQGIYYQAAIKKLNSRKALLVRTDLGSEIETIGAILHYIENKIKFNSINYQIKFEDRKDWEKLGLKIKLENIFKKPDLKDNKMYYSFQSYYNSTIYFETSQNHTYLSTFLPL